MYCTDTFVGGNKIFFSNFRNFEEMSLAPSLRNPGSTTALKYILLCLMNSKKIHSQNTDSTKYHCWYLCFVDDFFWPFHNCSCKTLLKHCIKPCKNNVNYWLSFKLLSKLQNKRKLVLFTVYSKQNTCVSADIPVLCDQSRMSFYFVRPITS